MSTPFDYRDNPAGRLLPLIRTAQKHANSAHQRSKPISCYEGWALTFELSPDSKDAEFEVFHRMLEVHHEVLRLEEAVAQIKDEDDRNSFAASIGNLKTITPIAEARSIQFFGIIHGISQEDLVVLSFCSRFLHKEKPESIVESTELASLHDDVLKLFERVRNSSSLDPDLRTWLLRQLNIIERGIREYQIGGLESLRTALGDVIGSTIVNAEIVQKTDKNDEIGQFTNAVNKMAAMVQFATTSMKLLDGIKSILPHLLH